MSTINSPLFKNSFTKELPADITLSNNRRQVFNACYSYVNPTPPLQPKLVHVSTEVAELLGFSNEFTESKEFLQLVSGAKVAEGSTPYAMCYGGHQFGNWAGQLGDGRAINLGEIKLDPKNKNFQTLQLKGAGETPYSRTADGLAVLRSSIREHLMSEAMFHLGVPTTRSLSLCLTGKQVLRDVMYDGNSAYEKGAIVCRVAPSFIRFGNFQIHSARKETETLRALVNYTIRHFHQHLKENDKESIIQFLREVANKTIKMVIEWQRVGFTHGVMNTDNMSILGLTIDYGPYGWQDNFDPNWTPNTTDRENRRYRFGNQPMIAMWNIVQLANALFPLIEAIEPLQEVINETHDSITTLFHEMMRKKLGLSTSKKEDEQLIKELEQMLVMTETDMTIFYRLLANVTTTQTKEEALKQLHQAFYNVNELDGIVEEKWHQWLQQYLIRIRAEEHAQRIELMNATNPKYVLRNYMAQLIIEDADKGNYALLNEIYEMLKHPYHEQPHYEKWFTKRPDWARNKIGSSMLSCSS